MKLRLVASVIAVASLAYACGPRPRADATNEFPVAQQGFALASISAAPVRLKSTREKTLKNESIKLETTFDVAQRDDAVTFALKVTNTSGKRVELNFANGQAYDFIVVDSVGREVWRWADGRIFTQSVQNKLLSKGERMAINETWSPAKRGKYTAVAVLRATNYPMQQRVDFEKKK